MVAACVKSLFVMAGQFSRLLLKFPSLVVSAGFGLGAAMARGEQCSEEDRRRALYMRRLLDRSQPNLASYIDAIIRRV
jgi:hypothetical protein